VLVGLGARDGWWRPLPAPHGDTATFIDAAKGRYAAASKGNMALVLIANGRVAGTYFASHGRPVDGKSLFQVASMSKWITAWAVMTLVEQGRIDLDAPVSRYLHRWKLPPSEFSNDDVTVRRLLSHTAGLTDDLGFRGFAPGQKPATIEAELTHAADPMPFSSGVVRVGIKPGSWRYSGGGFLILQLLIEEVSHRPFNDYLRQAVLQPLGMHESTFVDPDPVHLADFYDSDGSRAVHYKFTALAAASLYTSTDDLTHFLLAQLKAPNGAPPGRGVLKPRTLERMRIPQARVLGGIPLWGLGEILYAPTNTGGFVIGHDGNNYPAINTTARLDPATGDGIIVLETGNGTVASRIGSDWTYWHTGVVDLPTLVFEWQGTVTVFAVGAFLIILAAIVIGWRGRRRRT
jgi:CubicO group peptidase (beta-lactamase class C family)